jgi:hypothetical protein
MQISEEVLVALRLQVVKALCNVSYRQSAEDVAQELVCDAIRQPGTRKLVTERAPDILDGRMPLVLKMRVRSKAHAMMSRNCQIDEYDDSMIVDRCTPGHEESVSEAVEELVTRVPWLGGVLEAARNGCQTWKEVASYLGIPERTFYTKLLQARLCCRRL